MTIYIVRHGSAGRRNGADPADGARHLDDKGRRQAAAVADRLSSEPLRAVVSSPLPRCVETVQPLADALGLPVAIDDRLVEGTPIEASWEVLAAYAGDNVVLCSHGDVIPDLIERNQRRGMRVEEPTGFAKGSLWALEGWDGSAFAKGIWDKLRH